MQKRIAVPVIDTFIVGSVSDYRARRDAASKATSWGTGAYVGVEAPLPRTVVTRIVAGYEVPGGLTIGDVDEVNAGVIKAILDGPTKAAKKATRSVLSSMSEMVGRSAPSMREALGYAA